MLRSLVFLGLWIAPLSVLGANDLATALLETADKTNELITHDLEFQSKTVYRMNSQLAGDQTTERIILVREIFNRTSGNFVLCNASGNWRFSVANDSMIDGKKTQFVEGTGEKANCYTEGFESPTWISGEQQHPVLASRPDEMRAAPVTFLIPSAGSEDQTRQEVFNILAEGPKVSFDEVLEIDHFDMKKSARVVRVFRELKDRSGKPSNPLGVELIISNDGDDQGLVIGMGFSFLKMEATEYKEKSDVKWTQHSVRSKWEKFRNSDVDVIVPVEVEQHFAIPSGNSDRRAKYCLYLERLR